jgi:hypothetical protein
LAPGRACRWLRRKENKRVAGLLLAAMPTAPEKKELSDDERMRLNGLGVLTVYMRGAKGLMAADSNGLSDPCAAGSRSFDLRVALALSGRPAANPETDGSIAPQVRRRARALRGA